jgi:hypothetical protein
VVSTGIILRIELNFRSGIEDIAILELDIGIESKTEVFVAKYSSDLKQYQNIIDYEHDETRVLLLFVAHLFN